MKTCVCVQAWIQDPLARILCDPFDCATVAAGACGASCSSSSSGTPGPSWKCRSGRSGWRTATTKKGVRCCRTAFTCCADLRDGFLNGTSTSASPRLMGSQTGCSATCRGQVRRDSGADQGVRGQYSRHVRQKRPFPHEHRMVVGRARVRPGRRGRQHELAVPRLRDMGPACGQFFGVDAPASCRVLCRGTQCANGRVMAWSCRSRHFELLKSPFPGLRVRHCFHCFRARRVPCASEVRDSASVPP